MDIGAGRPTVTDLSPLFAVASRRTLSVCLCDVRVRRSHTLLLLFFAVDGG